MSLPPFDIGDTQAVALALQKLSEQRPGWHYYLRSIAAQMEGGEQLFDDFDRMSRAPTRAELGRQWVTRIIQETIK